MMRAQHQKGGELAAWGVAGSDSGVRCTRVLLHSTVYDYVDMHVVSQLSFTIQFRIPIFTCPCVP